MQIIGQMVNIVIRISQENLPNQSQNIVKAFFIFGNVVIFGYILKKKYIYYFS